MRILVRVLIFCVPSDAEVKLYARKIGCDVTELVQACSTISRKTFFDVIFYFIINSHECLILSFQTLKKLQVLIQSHQSLILSANIVDSHCNIINKDLESNSFSDGAKKASVRPIYKKKSRH